MKISFKIKEKLSEIRAEIMHSDKWYTLIKEEKRDYTHILIKDPSFETEASVEIRHNEIHIRSVWFGNFTYRITQKADGVWCEYNGADEDLLMQNLLPRITPKEKILHKVTSHVPIRYDEFIKIGVPMPPIFD